MKIICPHCKKVAARVLPPLSAPPRMKPKRSNDLDVPIGRLNLTPRARNAMLNENITTIGELISRTAAELLRIPNFGRKSLRVLEEELAARGHCLGELE